jgi:2-polyprenyl-3-methyl-5-hydroxy-6-metoxy-1,4-benzoquinol methylase
MMHKCRFCSAALRQTFCDLGAQPLSNAFLTAEALDAPEPHYPLHARVCERCFLVQVQAFAAPEAIFTDYAYFSSYSDAWVAHAGRFAEAAVARCGLGPSSLVIEVASNDGYLLQHFGRRGVPTLGVEPAANVADAARKKGIETLTRFFGTQLAQELRAAGRSADLLVGMNVFAHVPDLNDFTAGLKIALKPRGTLVLEFPHLLRLMEQCQYDTIYQEHFSYFSLQCARRVLAAHDLEVVDVEEVPTHGGSLRLFVRHAGTEEVKPAVRALLAREDAAGLGTLDAYAAFGRRVVENKRRLLALMTGLKDQGASIVAYGAAAKGNTLLNYCGLRGDFIDYVVDRNPYKQGRYLPGTRIPVVDPSRVFDTRPAYLLILPWNLKDEVMAGMAGIRAWGGRFIVPIPAPEVLA